MDHKYDIVKDAFQKTVNAKAKEVDPDDSKEWLSLAYGFFLAYGIPPKIAWENALRMLKELWNVKQL